MSNSDEKWAILYGFGTPSARVDTVARSRTHAMRLLDSYSRSWGTYAPLFSAHRYADVVSRATQTEYVLKKHVFGSRAARRPEGVRRVNAARESVSFIRKRA